MKSDQTVLITGASTGIGLAIARALCESRYRVILTARQSSLPRFAMHEVGESQHVRIRALDVTSAEQREAIIAEAEERAARLGGWTSSRHSNYPTTDVPIQRLPMAHRWFRVGSQFSSWCASLPRTLTHAPHLDTVSARYRVPVPWYHDGPFSTNERRWRT